MPKKRVKYKVRTIHPLKEKRQFNVLAIVGFVLSFLGGLSIIGIALSAVALVQIQKTGERGRGLAIAGLVIGILIFTNIIVRRAMWSLI